MAEMSKGRKLLRVRAQVKLVQRLQDQLREMEPELRSPVLTDMPKNVGALAQGLDAKLSRKDALERILMREGALLRKYEREAREEMDMMKPDLYAFCTMYYLSGLSVEETALMIERSERQCRRYIREIEDGEEMAENGRKCHIDNMVSGVI